MPTHTFKEHKRRQAQTLAHRYTLTHTQPPKNPAGWGSHALTSGSQSKGCCSAAHKRTTDLLCSSCKFCSFSSGLRRGLCCFVKRKRRIREEWWAKRTEEWSHSLCVTAKSLCLHEGWDCVCVSLCACVCVYVCDPLQYVRIKRAENKGPLVWDENIDPCNRPNKINWSNGHTYFHYSASLPQPGENPARFYQCPRGRDVLMKESSLRPLLVSQNSLIHPPILPY